MSSETVNNLNQGLTISTNFKAGRPATNPSVLITDQMVVRGLKVSTNIQGGAFPCRPLYNGID